MTIYSTTYCCPNCHDAVRICETPAGEPVYECQTCGKCVMVGCAEDALAKIDDVTLKLPIRRTARLMTKVQV